MKVIKIAWIYPKYLSYHGDFGNIRYLESIISRQGIKPVVTEINTDSEIDFDKFDIIYFGGSENYKTKFLLETKLIKQKSKLKKAIDSNKIIIAVGTSFQMFGKYFLEDKSGAVSHNGLGIFNFYTELLKTTDIIIGDLYEQIEFNDKEFTLLGSVNNNATIHSNLESSSKKGKQSFVPEIKSQTTIRNNFIGTNLIGPVLLWNPELANEIIKVSILQKKKTHKWIDIDQEYQFNARKFLKDQIDNAKLILDNDNKI